MNTKTCLIALSVVSLAAALAAAKPSPLELKVRGAIADVAGSSGFGAEAKLAQKQLKLGKKDQVAERKRAGVKVALEPVGLDPNDRSPDAMRARNDYWDAENKSRDAEDARSDGDSDRASRDDSDSKDLYDRSDREIRDINNRHSR